MNGENDISDYCEMLRNMRTEGKELRRKLEETIKRRQKETENQQKEWDAEDNYYH